MIIQRYATTYEDARYHTPDHPSRTARRGRSCDVLWQVWESREAMICDIEKEQAALLSLGNVDGANRFRWYPCSDKGDV
jgi:uridine phosphorylase